MNDVNSILICREDYKSQEDFENAIKKAILVLLDNNYIMTVKWEEKGLAKYIVSELLWRLKGKAGFATVSGQCNNSTNPEKLYRKCGFTGNDVWHILRKR